MEREVKRTYRQAGSDFVINTASLAAIGLGVTAWAEGSWPWWAGFALIGGGTINLVKQNATAPPRTPNWTALASTAKTLAFDAPGEFVFRGLGLPVPVSEASLERFTGIAKHRTIKARYGWRAIKAKDVLSKRHFTHRVSPPFVDAEYLAILTIYGYCRVLVGRRRGHSGWLMDVEDYTAQRYVEMCRRRWVNLQQPGATWFNVVKRELVAGRL